MTQTENYNLTLVEGSDKVNLLTQMNPNTTAIDTQMKDNADHGIQDATELFTSTVHAITRQNPDAPIFRFTAVSNFTAGETFTVDGVQVTALLTSGEALTTGSFIIGSEVICALRDTLLTVFVNAGTAAIAKNAEKLGGELPEYYGTAEDVADAVESATTALETANGANTAVGNLSSLTTATKTSVVGAVNEVNENLTKDDVTFHFDCQDGVYGWNESSERGADTFHPFSSKADLLWQASSSILGASSFNADLSKYDCVIVYYMVNTTVSGYGYDYEIVPIGRSVRIAKCGDAPSSGAKSTHWRLITATTTSVSWGVGELVNPTGAFSSPFNYAATPRLIYGAKLGIF